MHIVKMIFDFILSLGHLFFRGKERGRKGRARCQRCGALLRTDRPCGCGESPDGDRPGGSGGDPGVERPTEETTALMVLYDEERLSQLMGWFLMAVGVYMTLRG